MRLVFDTETDGLLDEVTKIHCIHCRNIDIGESYRFGPDPEEIRSGITALSMADELIGHNIVGYDLVVLKMLYGFDWPIEKTTDTLLLSRLCFGDMFLHDQKYHKKQPGQLMGKHSLEAWGHRLGNYKGDFKGPWDQWTQVMDDYCGQDVDLGAQLYEHLMKRKPDPRGVELEHRFTDICLRYQTQPGFPFDRAAAEALHADLVAERERLAHGLVERFGEWWGPDGRMTEPKKPYRRLGIQYEGPHQKIKRVQFNPGSRAHIQKVLEDAGWVPEEYTKSGQARLDDETIGRLQFPEAQAIGRYLTVGKRIGQIADGDEAWLRKVAKDGRIHGEVVSTGTVTGRCAHRNPNLAQVPRVGSPFGAECRALFTAEPGMLLVGFDASGIELRCLAHYLHRYDGGAFVKELLEGDPHTTLQLALGDLVPEGKLGRDAAKTIRYAGLYGAGLEKLGRTSVEYLQRAGAPVPKLTHKGIGQKVKERMARSMPGFKELQEDLKRALKRRSWLRGLDGRQLAIRNDYSALNTLLQSAGGLIMKQACILLHDDLATDYVVLVDYWQAAHVHDEMQLITRPEIADDVGTRGVNSIVRAGEYFSFRCPLNGDHKKGANWAETH